jgi:hypothetical protein
MLLQFDYVTKLSMPLIVLYFFIICHVVNIFGVGIGFTSPSKPMRHPFGNDAHHINLWGASFPNCPTYFVQSKNGDQRVLSGYSSSGVSVVRGFSGVTPLFSITPILDVWSENSRVMRSESWTEDTWELV